MKKLGQVLRFCIVGALAIGFAYACAFDGTLRAYLNRYFWMPFAKGGRHFEKRGVKRVSVAYAGMMKDAGVTPLSRLRAAYQQISDPDSREFLRNPKTVDDAKLRQAVAAARAGKSLTAREREEVDLIDAKIELRAAEEVGDTELASARKKFEAFLRMARTPEFLSEARGWLARVHYLSGDRTAAGKIYLDELNRNGSNLSRETLLTSLRMVYGYDGGDQLLAHLDEYFDTPEHAAFAIELVTNPHADESGHSAEVYPRLKSLLDKHAALLKSNDGAHALALLTIRTALRMGDPPEALKLAESVPVDASIRAEPDFLWMLASAEFLNRKYAEAEDPLRRLFNSLRASPTQRAAAAYALCGVYGKLNNPYEQLKFALWLHASSRLNDSYEYPPRTEGSVYWAASGFDLNLLLDSEAPLDTLEEFIKENPKAADIGLVKYSLAVRLARENRYAESAKAYDSIGDNAGSIRAQRMRRLAGLYREATRTDLEPPQKHEAMYKLAEYVSENPERLYFNAALWDGFQGYALNVANDSRLTGEEHRRMTQGERKLRDDQEELWRAYLILHAVVQEEGKTSLGRKAALLAIRSVRRISYRFGREAEIRNAELELSTSLAAR